MMDDNLVKFLNTKTRNIRREIVKMFAGVGNGHFGGSLSCVEIVTALYYHVLQLKPKYPEWPGRDRFIMSKGHGVPAVYAALSDKSFFPKEWLETFDKLGGPLNTHPNRKKIPGVEVSTGSLGHGLSLGVGMALATRHLPEKYKVYVLLGDGECHEGSIWEAAMYAAHLKLDNLYTIVDHNQLCVGGKIENIVTLEPFNRKWEAFGWDVKEVDGHSFEQVIPAIKSSPKDQPRVVIAHTIKGKGISFMENRREWHGAHVNKDIIERAMAELN